MNKKQDEMLDKFIEFLSSPEKLEAAIKGCSKEEKGEILSLLEVVKNLYTQAPPSLSAEKKEEIKLRLLASAQTKKPLRKRATLPLILKRAIATSAALFLLGSGVAAASARSLPDSLFYPVKLATERVRLAIARNDKTRAHLEISFAERRLKESKAVVDQPEALQKAVEEMSKDTSSAVKRVMESSENNKEELAAELIALTEKQQEVLSSVVESAPEQAKDALIKALEASRHGKEQAVKALTKEVPVKPKIRRPRPVPPSLPKIEDMRPVPPPTSSLPIREGIEEGTPEMPYKQ